MGTAIERVEASWANLVEAIEGIPEERIDEPGVAGEWSVKDVLGHLAYWDGEAIEGVERSLNGDSESSGDDGDDFEVTNQREQAVRSGRSVAKARQELFGTHDRLLAALRQHPTIDPNEIAGDTFEHYDEHAADIRAWRQRLGI